MPSLTCKTLFVGRTAELKILEAAYEAARSGKPRIVGIVAESGYGKTRLVQEFFSWLSTKYDAVGREGYWPDARPYLDDNLHINPPFPDREPEVPLPFLWWGLRLCDPHAHNEIVGGALWPGVQYLRQHLGAYRRQNEIAGLKRQQGITFAVGLFNAAFDAVANTLSLNLAGFAKTAVEAIAKLDKQRTIVRELNSLKVAPAAVSGRAEADLETALISDLSLLAKHPPDSLPAVPLILVVDDAQWLDKDPSLLRMLTALITQARSEAWPLLVLMTSWEREWHTTLASGQPLSVMSPEAGDRVIWLGRIQDLELVVRHALPGLTPVQAEMTVCRAGQSSSARRPHRTSGRESQVVRRP